MKKLIVAILAITMALSLIACGSMGDTQDTSAQSTTQESTTPLTQEPTENTQPQNDSLQIGNLRFSLDSGMTVKEIGEETYMVTLKGQRAFVTMYAGDVSAMDVDMADLFVDIQHKSFTEDRDTILSETEHTMDIAGFSADGEVCTTTTDSGVVWGHMDHSFTDTWYSYTFMLQFVVGNEKDIDSDNAYSTSKEYGELYGHFLSTVSYIGPAPRESGNNNPETNPAEDATSATQVPQLAGPTTAESNALKKAKEYLRVMSFSHDGLIEQLEYEGFSTNEATYGADNCGADWFVQAAKSAESYINVMAYSRESLIEQLEYEGFTYEQAVHGADSVGLK